MEKYTIAGYGKFKYIRKISEKKANKLKSNTKNKVFDSYEDADEELEKGKK